MIKIDRSSEVPPVLTENRDNWLAVARAEMSTGVRFNKTTVAGRYNHPEIKSRLLADNFSKCMYCESKITHIDYGDIEHIKPKATYPAEAFDWTNLGLTCSKCNNLKREHYLPNPVIDPYTEDPDMFIFCDGQMIYGRPATDRGQITVIKLDLNRLELLEQRRRKMDEIYNLVDRASRISDEDLKGAILSEADKLTARDSDYAFVSIAFLNGLKQLLGI